MATSLDFGVWVCRTYNPSVNSRGYTPLITRLSLPEADGSKTLAGEFLARCQRNSYAGNGRSRNEKVVAVVVQSHEE